MPVFSAYASYYNLLYKDKDYAGESAYIHNLIRTYRPQAQTILDLGCGTGRHDQMLAEYGYEITGVDRSKDMLAASDITGNPMICFVQGDIRTVRLEKTFDVAVSLFHVMSYQTENEDLMSVLATAKAHLKPDGIFIFDCWYGPAVLTDRPMVRVKRLEDETTAITRIAEPVMHPNENLVDVHYRIISRDRQSHATEELHEIHHMRYLFAPELKIMLSSCGMKIVEYSGWMSGEEAGFDTWNVCFVVQG